jgi:hypothetical protein
MVINFIEYFLRETGRKRRPRSLVAIRFEERSWTSSSCRSEPARITRQQLRQQPNLPLQTRWARFRLRASFDEGRDLAADQFGRTRSRRAEADERQNHHPDAKQEQSLYVHDDRHSAWLNLSEKTRRDQPGQDP